MKWFDNWISRVINSGLEKRLKVVENNIHLLRQENESLKNKNLEYEKNIKFLTNISKEITEGLKTIVEEDDTNKEQNLIDSVSDKLESQLQKLKERREKDLDVMNRNFKFVNDKVNNVDKKIDVLIETVAEKIANDDEALPNLYTGTTTLRTIFQMKNKTKASLYSLVYLLKKQFDEKGIKV